MITLPITPEQAELLADALQQADRAQERVSAVFSAVIRGHGLTEGTFVRLDGTSLALRTPADG